MSEILDGWERPWRRGGGGSAGVGDVAEGGQAEVIVVEVGRFGVGGRWGSEAREGYACLVRRDR